MVAPPTCPDTEGTTRSPFGPSEMPAFRRGSLQAARAIRQNRQMRCMVRAFLIGGGKVAYASVVFQRATCSATLMGEVPP